MLQNYWNAIVERYLMDTGTSIIVFLFSTELRTRIFLSKSRYGKENICSFKKTLRKIVVLMLVYVCWHQRALLSNSNIRASRFIRQRRNNTSKHFWSISVTSFRSHSGKNRVSSSLKGWPFFIFIWLVSVCGNKWNSNSKINALHTGDRSNITFRLSL